MILNYNKSFTHEDLVKDSIKKEKVKVFKKEDFDNYVKEIKEKEDKEVTVLYNTKLRQVKESNIEEDRNYLKVNDLYFELEKPRNSKVKFYISIDEYSFICVEKNIPFLIIILLLVGFIAAGASLCIINPDLPDAINPLQMDKDQQDGEGDPISTPDSEGGQESTIIPGYADITATSTASLVPLSNPEENTVNFVYTILLKESSDVVKTFTDPSEAQEYITKNTVEYTNYKDGSKYTLKTPDGDLTNEFIEYKAEENGNAIDVVKNTYKMVYFSDGIAPGNHIDWNCYEYLGTGVFDVQFRISTYDVETSSQCYGATQPVHIVINQ